ncbi:MAG: zinc-dependent alcohol dehydrogenase family protein [Bacteroidetes bacterium]|nr:zinc-dependent alcohol dehydrogenase family protein [Bacteroidota bacterium]
MQAATYETFSGPITIQEVRDPVASPNGVIIEVMATGICRSDWHGWKGHDQDITLPHVPGHELAGMVSDTGKNVKNWKPGDRVTLPFVCGCGTCEQCVSGNQQVCDHQFQPGFTHWGSFAEYIAIEYADINLVRLPDDMAYETAASLGCRFATSFRAIVHQGKVAEAQWVAVYGCGGVGLSAIMIANALGAYVVGVDISEETLSIAKKVGSDVIINATNTDDIPELIREVSNGGVHVSIDALGSVETCQNSVLSLRKRGKHIQVGLLAGKTPEIPMDTVVANELELIGSHGIQAHAYPQIFEMIESGRLRPGDLISGRVSLQEGVNILENMDSYDTRGIVVINQFR